MKTWFLKEQFLNLAPAYHNQRCYEMFQLGSNAPRKPHEEFCG